MSHSTVIGMHTFLHDGDYSGDVRIVGPKTAEDGHRTTELQVPMATLEQFLAEKERSQVITYLEELDLSTLELQQHLQRIARCIHDLDA